MLIELRIQNYALIERLAVRLDPGLNVLTGETGAGKSIIVGALSLLLGERASAEAVRTGADKAVVEGVFDVAGDESVAALLAEQGLEAEDDLLILRREVAAEGRSRAWVNGSATTAGFLGELGRLLVDLHGQHESQTLLRPEEQRSILDAFGGSAELAASVRAAWTRLQQARRALEELDERRRLAEQRADFLRFQVDEIEKAKVQADEDERLHDEAHRLEHAEDLARFSGTLHQALYGGEDSVSAKLGDLRRVLDHLIRFDPTQEDARELLDSAFYTAEELGRRMGQYSVSVEHDPARLEEIRRRQDLLFRLKTKYGPTLADVIETGTKARAELDLLDGAGLERRELERTEAEAAEALAAIAAELSKKRRAGAKRLGTEVMAVLPDLGLGGRFEVALEALPAIGGDGAEGVEFRVALNAGFEPRALARVASGGELSRVMLALKTILARLDRVPTLIFDEVDVGIGGRVALQVGDRLRRVAEHHQVFVITHLAQIASRADHQLLVEKVEREGTTLTRVSEVREDERIRELARMLGGDPESATSLEHARELLGAVARA
ncbi:MAG TPA: DNA repair protein RecN [Longimicrobiales bacterium]|nr:DNA repair protein RecN [Longimicrobiales bacterium]